MVKELGMNEKKHNKNKIGVGSVVNTKVRDMEENTREVRIRRTRKDLIGMCPGCGGREEISSSIQKLQKKEMISCSIVYVCPKEEICLGMDDPISNL